MSKFRYLKIKSLLKIASKTDEEISPVRILGETFPDAILYLPEYSKEELKALGFNPDEFSEKELEEPISDEDLESIFGDLGLQEESPNALPKRPSIEEVERLYQESRKKI